MSLSDEERRAVIEYRIEKAHSALNEARKVSAISLWNMAANRLYYALYYAATALLISNHFPVHTHAGMITLINQHFVKTGILNHDDGRLIKKMYSLRQEGDYEDFVEVTEADVNTFFPQVEALINKLIALIN